MAAGLMAVLAAANFASAADIKLGGGGASIATVFIPIKSAFEKATGHNLIILQSTPREGIMQLLKEKLDVAAMAGEPEMISKAEKDGAFDKASIQTAEIGTNKIAVFVHPSNIISSLTKQQIKDLFTGRVSNWKEIGGSDEPVLVVWGKNTPSQNALFSKIILDGEKVTAEHLDTYDYQGIKDSVASNNGAVGINPVGMVDDTVKGISTDPEVSSPILMITKGNPKPPVNQLLEFVQTKGKKYIRQ